MLGTNNATVMGNVCDITLGHIWIFSLTGILTFKLPAFIYASLSPTCSHKYFFRYAVLDEDAHVNVFTPQTAYNQR
jgi:hypothetical protein